MSIDSICKIILSIQLALIPDNSFSWFSMPKHRFNAKVSPLKKDLFKSFSALTQWNLQMENPKPYFHLQTLNAVGSKNQWIYSMSKLEFAVNSWE